ncbi:MAG: hypothetical protein LBS83_00015 [Holosporales bacterium]|nr:hypothetical protein [Holosporales bacterium]
MRIQTSLVSKDLQQLKSAFFGDPGIFGYLKRTMMLEHTRHRSVANMAIHVFSVLISYQLMTTKPSITPFEGLSPNP